MRLLLGLILGALFTVGGAYILDSRADGVEQRLSRCAKMEGAFHPLSAPTPVALRLASREQRRVRRGRRTSSLLPRLDLSSV